MARRDEMDTYGNRTYGNTGTATAPGAGRSPQFGSGNFGGRRASGGFGAPITMPQSSSRSRFTPQQDQPTPTGGPQSASPLYTPQDITAGLNGTPPSNPTPLMAPTGDQTAANPGQYAGTSFDPTRNIRNMNEITWTQFPTGGANSSPEGSGIGANGEYSYVAANAPLDTSKFTPAPAPEPTPLTSAQQAEQDVQSLSSQLFQRYPELKFSQYLSGNPNRGGFSITDPSVQAHYAQAWGRPLNSALLGEASLQNAAGTSGYDPAAIAATLRRYV